MRRLLAIGLLLALACAGTPEKAETDRAEGDCRTVEGETAIRIDCGPSDAWSERAVEEAEEGFEEREPVGRP